MVKMERGSCCLGLSPCSSTQNMALCSAHESLWHRQQRWVWGWEGVQLGDRGLLGGAQLAARVLTALKHTGMNMDTHTHTQANMHVLKKRGDKKQQLLWMLLMRFTLVGVKS